MTIDVIKLIAVFAVIIILLRCKLKLFVVMLAAILATILLWKIPVGQCFRLLWSATWNWGNFTVLLIFYAITFLQRLMEKRQLLKLAQKDLNGIFNNRRVNATLAPVLIGLLPSAAAMLICGDIVSEACADRLSIEEKATVASYFRHIPESFLPTYTSVILLSSFSGVSIPSFLLGMLPLEIVLFALGWFFYVRRIPKETGAPPSQNRKKDVLNLFSHLWVLFAIILLILIFKVPTWLAVIIMAVVTWFVYRFKIAELPGFLKSAVEPVMLTNTYLILVFKEFLTYTGVIKTLPEVFSGLPVPQFLIYALIFFFGAVVSGANSIIAICTVMAFSAVPGAGMPLMVLLNSFSYAAMQLSPTHICLTVAADYFHCSLGGIVKKTLPIVVCFCIIAVGYYLLLTWLL